MDVNFSGCPDVTDDGNKDGKTVLVCVKRGVKQDLGHDRLGTGQLQRGIRNQ
jgi:hypothetical protein